MSCDNVVTPSGCSGWQMAHPLATGANKFLASVTRFIGYSAFAAPSGAKGFESPYPQAQLRRWAPTSKRPATSCQVAPQRRRNRFIAQRCLPQSVGPAFKNQRVRLSPKWIRTIRTSRSVSRRYFQDFVSGTAETKWAKKRPTEKRNPPEGTIMETTERADRRDLRIWQIREIMHRVGP